MSLDEGRQSQRPYRYGMVLLCAGALINWLGLAEDYAEPVRYVGVACIVAGALLICAAMCCWLQSPARQPQTDRASPDTHQVGLLLTYLLLIVCTNIFPQFNLLPFVVLSLFPYQVRNLIVLFINFRLMIPST